VEFRLNRRNLRWAALATFLLALAIVFFWPDSTFAIRLVILTTVFGAGAGLIWTLTFWHKARVQIGRRGLRFKAVRWTAFLAAVFNLSFLLVRILSTSIASRDGDSTGQTMWAISLESSLPVAIAHLEGDEGHQIEDALVRGLEPSESKLPIRIIGVDQTFEASSSVPKSSFNSNVVHALLTHGAFLMFWGIAEKSTGVTRLYESGVVQGAQFGGSYGTADFKLPELPVEELVPVLWLILAKQSSRIRPLHEKSAAAALTLPLEQVRRLAIANATKSSWNADTRARVNFVLGRLTGLQGEWASDDKPLRISIVDYLSALSDWAGPDHALDRAMTLRCLAETLGGLTHMEHDLAVYNAAVQAYQAAIAIYSAAGDKIDEAQNQLMLGQILTAIALIDNNKEASQANQASNSALKVFDKEHYPQEWAEAQQAIAMNLANLGLHEAGPQGLREAVTILNDVLLVRTRAQMPHEWAVTQLLLGETLEKLGEQEPGASYFAEAVSAEKSALEVLRPGEHPDFWPEAQGALGTALSGVAQRDNSIDDFKHAIAAMRAGATDGVRERDPQEWLKIRSVLVMSLDQLGQLEWRQESLDQSNWETLDRSAEEHLEEAVVTARASLGEASKDGTTWAYLQSKLGDSLGVIGAREAANNKDEAAEHLQEGITADRAALRVMTMQNDPENWADTENTLGDALQELGKRESNPDYLEQAIASYQQAAKVQTLDRDPASWAATQNSIGSTYEALGMRENGSVGNAHLQQAVSSYRAALKVTTPDNDFMNWLVNQRNLAHAEAELGGREPDVDHLQQAASDYREELKYLSPDRSPTEWKAATEGLTNVLDLLRRRGSAG
jgi:tetratricopeptide (TPR) repeat protein